MLRLCRVLVELGIQKYYAGKKGNAHGVEVRVVAVNIEKAKPDLTAKFIKELGLEFVLNDFEGELLAKLGGAGTPFLVVLDGTKTTREKPVFQTVYKKLVRVLLKEEYRKLKV